MFTFFDEPLLFQIFVFSKFIKMNASSCLLSLLLSTATQITILWIYLVILNIIEYEISFFIKKYFKVLSLKHHSYFFQ